MRKAWHPAHGVPHVRRSLASGPEYPIVWLRQLLRRSHARGDAWMIALAERGHWLTAVRTMFRDSKPELSDYVALLERMKMEHLLAQLDGVCEHAAKGDLERGSSPTPWRPSGAGGTSAASRAASSWPGCPGSRAWIRTTSTFSPRSTASRSASSPA